MIGKKGASCRKDHGQRNILIHKRDILLSYEHRGETSPPVCMRWTKSSEGYLLCQKRQTLWGERGNALRGPQVLIGTVASTCRDDCKYLQERLHVLAWRMQCTARTDAVHCEDGCSALQRRLQCTASEMGKTGTWIVSPILDKRKGRRDTPLTSHCSPSDVSGDSWFHFVHGEIPQKIIRRYWKDFKTETSLTWMPSVCCVSVQRLRISYSCHSGGVSVPQGVNRNELDQLLCSHP